MLTADMTYNTDVRLEGSKIESVSPNLSGDKELDASGCYIMPGGIDPHTRCRLWVLTLRTISNPARAA